MRYNTITDVQTITTAEAFVEKAIELLAQAHRTVRIRSALLDPSLFDDAAFNEALSAFARQSRFSEVHILIDFPAVILQRSGRTLALARRLSDRISIKHYYDVADENRDSMILADQQGLLIKPVSAEGMGLVSLTDKIACKELVEQFTNEWALSPLARELRQLAI